MAFTPGSVPLGHQILNAADEGVDARVQPDREEAQRGERGERSPTLHRRDEPLREGLSKLRLREPESTTARPDARTECNGGRIRPP